MIPIRDENVIVRRPLATWALLVALAAVWVLVQGTGGNPRLLAKTVCNYGLVAGEITKQAPLGAAVPLGHQMWCLVDADPLNVVTPFTSMFLHASWGHLLGNALFLWVFGRAVEDSMGRLRFLGFYLLCGLGAALAQVIVGPSSPVPMVGASGAISGVMGAYLLLYPRVRVHVLLFLFVIRVPAWMMLLWWVGLQVLVGLPQLLPLRPEISEGVAVWAHIGGFATGIALVRLFVNRTLIEQRLYVGSVLRSRLA
jgi:membrane associated rhomboid family serine protease